MKFSKLIFISILISCNTIPSVYQRVNGQYEKTGIDSCDYVLKKINNEWAINKNFNAIIIIKNWQLFNSYNNQDQFPIDINQISSILLLISLKFSTLRFYNGLMWSFNILPIK